MPCAGVGSGDVKATDDAAVCSAAVAVAAAAAAAADNDDADDSGEAGTMNAQSVGDDGGGLTAEVLRPSSDCLTTSTSAGP